MFRKRVPGVGSGNRKSSAADGSQSDWRHETTRRLVTAELLTTCTHPPTHSIAVHTHTHTHTDRHTRSTLIAATGHSSIRLVMHRVAPRRVSFIMPHYNNNICGPHKHQICGGNTVQNCLVPTTPSRSTWVPTHGWCHSVGNQMVEVTKPNRK